MYIFPLTNWQLKPLTRLYFTICYSAWADQRCCMVSLMSYTPHSCHCREYTAESEVYISTAREYIAESRVYISWLQGVHYWVRGVYLAIHNCSHHSCLAISSIPVSSTGAMKRKKHLIVCMRHEKVLIKILQWHLKKEMKYAQFWGLEHVQCIT